MANNGITFDDELAAWQDGIDIRAEAPARIDDGLRAYIIRSALPVEASFTIVEGVVTEGYPGAGPR